MLYHSFTTSPVSFVKFCLEPHPGHFRETPKCSSGQKSPGLWTPLSITPGKSYIRVTVIYRHIQCNRSTLTLSLHQSMSVLSLKSPWNRGADCMHAVVTEMLSTGYSQQPQAATAGCVHAHGTPFSPSSCCHCQSCCPRAIQHPTHLPLLC